MPEVGGTAWLAEELAGQLTRALESMMGEPPSVTSAPHQLTAEEIDPANGERFWWEQRFSLSENSLVWIGAGTPTWEEIGSRVLKSAGVEDQNREDIRSTYLEIVNQALSGVAGAVSARARKEVSCTEGRSAPPPTSADIEGRLFEITLGEAALPLLAVFSSSVGSLSDAPAPPMAKAAARSAPDAVPVNSQSPSSIDLLLDVELPVSISFGRAQLPLKDVIKLTTGSIVELNRALSEPVEVIVNNCVIARGEVVVVEGNYGIRIKQVVSRQERLRTLT